MGTGESVLNLTWRGVTHREVHGERSEAPVGGQAEGGVLVEDLPVQVDAYIRFHILGTVIQHLTEGRHEGGGVTEVFCRLITGMKVNMRYTEGWGINDAEYTGTKGEVRYTKVRLLLITGT